MMNTKPERTLAEILGIADLPPEKQAIEMERVGMLIVDAAVGRLLVTLDEAEIEILEDYLATSTGTEDVFLYLLETYPQFEGYVQEEMNGLCSEAEEILS